MVDLTVLGISLQDEHAFPVLLLHPQRMERILVLSIGPMEAFAISSVLNAPEPLRAGGALLRDKAALLGPDGRTGESRFEPSVFVESRSGEDPLFPRPQTHDLAMNMLQAMGGRLLAVEILQVADGVFLAEAVLSTGSSIVRTSCRPSDGVALALRCGARIRAANAVLACAENAEDVLNALPEHVRILAKARMTASFVLPGDGFSRPEAGRAPSRIPALSPAMEAALAVSDKFRGKTGSKDSGLFQKAETPDAWMGLNPMELAAALLESLEAEHPEALKPARSFDLADASASSGFSGLEAMDAVAADGKAESTILRRKGEKLRLSGADSGGAALPDKGPKIRISLVRQKADGNLELVDSREIRTPEGEEGPVAGSPRLFVKSGRTPEGGERPILSEDERWAALLKVLTPETKTPM